MNQRELTPKQKRFVDSYLSNGGKGVQAAIAAGYSERSANAAASRELAKPLIQQAVSRATLNAIARYAVPALHTIARLSEAAKSPYVQLEAAKDLLNRAGFAAPQRVDHRLDSNLTVSFDFGGSKAAVRLDSDPTHPGKSSQKLIDHDESDISPVDIPLSAGQDEGSDW